MAGRADVRASSGADDAPLDDRVLVARSRDDPTAFSPLYRRYVGRIHAFAFRRTRSREAAEDVTAATFEAALRGLDAFDDRRAGFGPWLFRIAANQLVDHYRREGRVSTPRGQRGLAVLADRAVTDETEVLDTGKEVAAMLDALATLRPRYQQALSLRYLADLDAEQSAAAMGCSKAALAVTLHRALGALRRAVGHEEAAS